MPLPGNTPRGHCLKRWDLHECWTLKKEDTVLAYAVLARQDGRIKQFYRHPNHRNQGLEPILIHAIARVYPKMMVLNVDARDFELCRMLRETGLDNSFNQFEMQLKL